MLPSANDIEYFLQVARTQNISRTARRLGISQPTLTQSIRKLEDAVGAPLFLRSQKGVRLTRAGHRVLGQVTTLFEVWSGLRRAALEEQNELTGRFRVGAHPSVARYLLPPFFRALGTRAPGIEVSLTHDLSRRVAEAVIGFTLDLGFVINPPRHPDLVLKRLGSDTVGIFAARRGRYGEALFGDPALVQTQEVLRKLKHAAFGYAQFVECANLEVIQSLVESGAGYGILPTRVAQTSPGGKLELVDAKLPVFHDEIYAVYRKEAMSTRAGKLLIEVCGSLL